MNITAFLLLSRKLSDNVCHHEKCGEMDYFRQKWRRNSEFRTSLFGLVPIFVAESPTYLNELVRTFES